MAFRWEGTGDRRPCRGGSERSKGYGSELFDWIVEYAKESGCDQIKLFRTSNVTEPTGSI